MTFCEVELLQQVSTAITLLLRVITCSACWIHAVTVLSHGCSASHCISVLQMDTLDGDATEVFAASYRRWSCDGVPPQSTCCICSVVLLCNSVFDGLFLNRENTFYTSKGIVFAFPQCHTYYNRRVNVARHRTHTVAEAQYCYVHFGLPPCFHEFMTKDWVVCNMSSSSPPP